MSENQIETSIGEFKLVNQMWCDGKSWIEKSNKQLDAEDCFNEITKLTEQLAKANERLKELEEELLMLTLATGRQEVWDLGKKLLNKFAIEQKEQELVDLKASLGCLDNRDASKFAFAINKRIEQLRKEQEK